MPAFVNTTEELTYYKRLEAETHRPAGPGVVHPDRCPKLHIRGVAWTIPPRGIQISPSFGHDGTVVEVITSHDERWPEIDALVEAVELPVDIVCLTCGQPTATSVSATAGLLRAFFGLAARALRSQYDLDNEQMAELLAFDATAAPAWFEPLLRWAVSLPEADPALVKRRKRSWLFWKRR